MIGQQSSRKAVVGAEGRDQRWCGAVLCLALAAITFGVFGQTLRHEFIDFDDNDYVYENPFVVQGLTRHGIVRAFNGAYAANWHPLTWLSHMLDCQLYGLHPGGHHLSNVLLQTATVIALFLVLRQMTGALWRSAFVAAVFAIHPLRVESVAWVAERKDVLSGLFFMLAIGAYVNYARHSWSVARYGLVVLLFAMGLMIKSMLVTLPLVLMLLDYWPLQRAQPGKLAGLVIEKLPLLALSAAACVATILAQHEGIQSAGSFSLPLRIGNALVACIIYLRQMVWPAGLAAFYPYPLNGQSAWEVGLAGMLLAGFSAVALNQRRKQPWIFVGWLWYLIMLLPVVGIVQVGDQAHADRYTYLPQIGIYVAVTWWVARLEAGRAAFGVLMASIVGALMFCAWKQTTHWKNNKTLWTHALNCTTRNYVAHFNLGNALRQEGKLDEAMSQYRSALQIRPDYPQAHNNLGKSFLQKGQVDNAITQFQQALQINPGLATAHYNLGAALFEKGKVDEAIAQYQLALQLSPGYAQGHFDLAVAFLQKGRVTEAITENQKGLQIDPGNAEACYNLGLSLRKQGRLDEAVAHYQRALEIRPGYAEARYNLGNVFAQQGRLDEAVAQYQKALELKPDYAEAHYNLGTAFLQQGRLDETIKQYQKALELKPDNAEGHYNLGNLFGQQGRLDEAIRHFQKALALQPDYAEAQNGLGNSFSQQGRMEEAIAHYQKAVELKPDYAEARRNLAWIRATSPQAALRNGKEAVELAERANQLTGGGNPLIVCTLAAAYAENGQFSEAVETAQRALSLAGASSNAPLVGQLQYELNLYQAGRPFHIPEQPH